jgi:hypothetical protein
MKRIRRSQRRRCGAGGAGSNGDRCVSCSGHGRRRRSGGVDRGGVGRGGSVGVNWRRRQRADGRASAR